MNQTQKLADGSALTQARFEDTHWSVVLSAVDGTSPAAQEAFEELCRIYWPPVYGYLRRDGHKPQDAEDLTQGFFAHIVGGGCLRESYERRGKFRSFLLKCLKHFVCNEVKKQHALKLGGGVAPLSLDLSEAEGGLGFEPADNDDPAKAFERRWAATLLDRAMARVREEYSARGTADLYNALEPFLTDQAERGDYGPAAAKLRMTNGATRTAATRLRKSFRKALRDEVGRTVGSQGEIDGEISYLFTVLQAR